MAKGTVFLLALLAVLGGCAIPPPASTPIAEFCNFRAFPIALPLSQPAAKDEGDTLVSEIEDALTARGEDREGQSFRVLALSGGSLNGAFGAGFLDGWRRSQDNGLLPEFDVVTGISTGSILATFAFLGDTERAVDRYSIRDESELLRPIIRNRRDGSMSPLALVRVIRRGAIADLAPLRDLLLVGDADHPPEISPAVMRAVAQAHAEDRKLYVGAVDVDSGQAVAFDMTQMATDYVAAGPPDASEETPRQARLRACYVEAIIASSSAPLAAVPVFIDNSMYVDGGMRFGMFAEDVIQGASRAEKGSGRRLNFYVIANGDLETNPQCGRAEEQMCLDAPLYGQPTDPRSTWSLLQLALRSEQVLVNQVYRFSADRIVGEQKLGNRVWFARINASRLQEHMFRMDDPALDTLQPAGAPHSCRDWQEEDRRTLHPIQFYPRYMHCLIDYGQLRGREGAWDVNPVRGKPEVAEAKTAP